MQAGMMVSELSTDDVGVGLPLVFLHGFPLNRRAWQNQIDKFQASYRVIAPDLRGMGQSQAQAGPTTMIEYADDVYGLLQPITDRPVVLIGHSMGGYVALAFARQYPERLCGLVLVSTKASGDSAEIASGRRATSVKVASHGVAGVQRVIDAMAPNMLAASNRDEPMHQAVRGLMATSTPAGVISALLGLASRADGTPFLSDISVPTLIITGDQDTLIPSIESQALARGIRGSQLSVIPNAGHLVAFERPQEFNLILSRWLDRFVPSMPQCP